ncbi:MAG: PKD domain-containing protein, partial [Gammaproteobacteria bacterium]
MTLLPNTDPTAAAGSDQRVLGGSLVTLDGSGSQDSDGQIASAVWRQEGGTPVVLTGADSVIASFTAPRPTGEEPLHFSLTVIDDSGASASDDITIIVLANQPPLADAGLDQSVTSGSFVGLHAEGSSDPEGGPLRYRWQQTEGAAVTLTGGDTATPSFTAPSPAADEILGFTLTVTDDEGEGASDIVRVEIRAAGVTRGPTTRVSMASDGIQANNASYDLAISADGRYVAFNSGASNLVGGDTNDWGDIFVHDRETGTTTRVTAAVDGTPANVWSNEPTLSADGRYVAFESNASNLVTGDTNDASDIFVHDRNTGTITRVSITSNGAQGHD